MAGTDMPSIAENEQVQELLAILKENNALGYEEFDRLINHVTEMEQHLSETTEELKEIRRVMQRLQNHSLKNTLQESCRDLEANISDMQQRLSKLKEQMIDGCKTILYDFKERGAVALNGIMHFLHLRPSLDAILNTTENGMQACDRAVSRIDVFSMEFHEAGRHLKNMSRSIQGKSAEAETKENGKIAMTFKGAFKVERALIFAVSRGAERSLYTLTRLEQSTQHRSSTTMYLWLIPLTASKELPILLLKLLE